MQSGAPAFVPSGARQGAAVAAQPFIPSGAGTLNASAGAAPFVPKSTVPVTAAPFVPSRLSNALGAAPSQLADSKLTHTTFAPPFVPGEAKAAPPQQSAAAAAFSPIRPAVPNLPGEEAFYSPGIPLQPPGSTPPPQGRGGALYAGPVLPTAPPAAAAGAGQRNPQRWGAGARGGAQPRPVAPGRALLSARFAPEAALMELASRSAAELAQLDPEGEEWPEGMPQMIEGYHSIFPLELWGGDDASAAFQCCSDLVKGVSSEDGRAYTLRRLDPAQVPPTAEVLAAARDAMERWAPLQRHPGVAALRTVFVSKDVDETHALFFVHDFHACTVTLEQAHCGGEGQPPDEETLWAYAVQLAAVLRAVHATGGAVRAAGLAPSKLLLCPRGRVRLSSVGVAETLFGGGGEEAAALQRADLAAAGQALLACACGTTEGPAVGLIARRFSAPLVSLISALTQGGVRDCAQLAGMLGERALMHLDAAQASEDAALADLAVESENGRMLRLLVKLGFVNERPDDDMSSQWAETGDRYLLKLFRDWVFHQVTDEGGPGLDWGHVFEALAKLDAGVPERVLLLSRDEGSMLVASYGDIKRCVNVAYGELQQAAQQAAARARAEAQLKQQQEGQQ